MNVQTVRFDDIDDLNAWVHDNAATREIYADFFLSYNTFGTIFRAQHAIDALPQLTMMCYELEAPLPDTVPVRWLKVMLIVLNESPQADNLRYIGAFYLNDDKLIVKFHEFTKAELAKIVADYAMHCALKDRTVFGDSETGEHQ